MEHTQAINLLYWSNRVLHKQNSVKFPGFRFTFKIDPFLNESSSSAVAWNSCLLTASIFNLPPKCTQIFIKKLRMLKNKYVRLFSTEREWNEYLMSYICLIWQSLQLWKVLFPVGLVFELRFWKNSGGKREKYIKSFLISNHIL